MNNDVDDLLLSAEGDAALSNFLNFGVINGGFGFGGFGDGYSYNGLSPIS